MSNGCRIWMASKSCRQPRTNICSFIAFERGTRAEHVKLATDFSAKCLATESSAPDLESDLPRIRIFYLTPRVRCIGHHSFADRPFSQPWTDQLFRHGRGPRVSTWGHDFRPAYLRLKSLRSFSQNDLESDSPRIRIFYRTPESAALDTIRSLIGRFHSRGQINYFVVTRADCEPIAQLVTKDCDIPADVYHAGLSDKKRAEVQQQWMSGAVPVVVAKIAFGMGVDKAPTADPPSFYISKFHPYQRFVIHWNPPQNMANYYQESGRDGMLSFARVYYSRDYHGMMHYGQRIGPNQSHSETKNVSEELVEQRKKEIERGFNKMIEYLESSSCHHALLGQYFDDRVEPCASHCDACKLPQRVRDALRSMEQSSAWKTSASREAADDASLYGGGRKGQERDTLDYSQTLGGDDAAERRGAETDGEREERLRVRAFLQKALRKRRQRATNDAPTDSSSTFASAATHLLNKVNGRGGDVPALVDPSLHAENQGTFPFLRSTDSERRELSRAKLFDELRKNQTGAALNFDGVERKMHTADALNTKAGQVEEHIFGGAKIGNIYAHRIGAKILELRK
ncbi:hypothetical protein niasHS_013934 [Heterodera schachtii]|uniref:DNA 3'-5' helicase n=1 Tax=Heterodera schachtii TaxID=97005 RepID=A0ABD2INL9_HETSC